MLGWRCRIGLLVPVNNMTTETEMWSMAPSGVTIHGARLRVTKADREAHFRERFPKLHDDAEVGAKVLSWSGLDVVAYDDNASSFYSGIEGNEELIERLETASGLPATTASKAIVEALDELSLENVTVITPYTGERNTLLGEFLDENDIEVAGLYGLDDNDAPSEYSKVLEDNPQESYRKVKQTPTEGSDGVLIVATDFSCISVIDALEEDLGLPVVTANQALFWHALQRKNVDVSLSGAGTLLS